MLKSLDETIMALTIENKRLEQEVLMTKNLMLKSQVPPTIQDKTSKKKSDKTVKPYSQASKAEKDSYIPTLKDLRADEKVVKNAAAITNRITNDTDDTDSTSDTESDSDTQSSPLPKLPQVIMINLMLLLKASKNVKQCLERLGHPKTV